MNLLACRVDSFAGFGDGGSGIPVFPFVALCGMLSLAYLVALPQTRGWRIWPLRVCSALAFVGICAAVGHLR